MAQKFTFSLDHNLATGAIQLDPSAHPELLAVFVGNGKLPDGDNLIEGGDLQVAPGQDTTIGPAKVGFPADVNAAIGVYSTPANLRTEMLKDAGLVSQIADAITLPQGQKLLLLRWGFDLSGTAPGSVAWGPAAFRHSQFTNPDAARKNLANFRQTLSADFNANLGVFAVGNALMPLGTAIYPAGARALDPTLDTNPAAMFTAEMLRAVVTSLDPSDTDVLHTARVVHATS
jgi:hypothetical protein